MDGSGAIEAASLSPATVAPTIWHFSVCVDRDCASFSAIELTY
jgi:hypothetical protein